MSKMEGSERYVGFPETSRNYESTVVVGTYLLNAKTCPPRLEDPKCPTSL